MKDLITIDSAPAKLDANFEEVQKELEKHLEQYVTVVTADGVKDAKAAATEINKLRGEIKRRVKAAVDEVSAPIQDFKDKGKTLENRCEEVRQHLLMQVEKYEDETREQARELLRELRDKLWDELGVESEHQRAEYEDLVKLTAVTKAGNLTSAARGDITQRCNADKARQDMVRMRLLELENRSYRAGLSAPLTKDHVHQWLEADEATYEQQLQRILDAEVARQEQSEQRMRQQLQREQEQQQQAEEDRHRREAAAEAHRGMDKVPGESAQKEEDLGPAEPEQPEEQHKPSPEPASAPSPESGKQGVTITCQFHTEVAPTVRDEAIEAELRRVMEKAGITTLTSITITRHETEGATEDA